MVANVLLLCADSPDPRGLGGVQLQVAALARLAPPTVRAFTAHVEGGDALVVATWQPRRRDIAEIPFARTTEDRSLDEPAFGRAVETALAATSATVLHVHSAGLGPRPLVAAVDRLGAGLIVTLHEHALVCEEYRLLELAERFCDIPADLRRCDRCLGQTRGRPPGYIADWRSAMAVLAERADVVIAPSESALALSARVHAELGAKAVVLPWGVPLPRVRGRPSDDSRQPLRIAIVGVVAAVKGHAVVPDLVGATAHLPVEWHWFGATEGNAVQRPRSGKLTVHGAYARDELALRLVRARIDVVVLPSVAPETFSLTLSEVLAAGLPVIASRLGALAERVTADIGWTFDPHDPRELVAVLELVTGRRELLTARAERIGRLTHRTEDDMAREHAVLWERVAAARPTTNAAWDAARAGVPEARRRAAARADTWLARAARALRTTNTYRDLRLRTLLSESARRRIIDSARRAFRR